MTFGKLQNLSFYMSGSLLFLSRSTEIKKGRGVDEKSQLTEIKEGKAVKRRLV